MFCGCSRQQQNEFGTSSVAFVLDISGPSSRAHANSGAHFAGSSGGSPGISKCKFWCTSCSEEFARKCNHSRLLSGEPVKIILPIRCRRMDTSEFQKRCENTLTNGGLERKLVGVSQRRIPDAPWESLERALSDLPSSWRTKHPCGEMSSEQREQQRRRIRSVPPGQQDSLGPLPLSDQEGWTYLQDTDPDLLTRYDDSDWQKGCLFLIGGVQPVKVRGRYTQVPNDTNSDSPDEIECFTEFDGNEFAILNMGSHGVGSGKATTTVCILFGWEVIRQFWGNVIIESTNFSRYVDTQLESWCESVRHYPSELCDLLPSLFHQSMDSMNLRDRHTSGHMSAAGLKTRASRGHQIFAASNGDTEYKWLVRLFTAACLDFKNLLDIDWDKVLQCTCVFRNAGPGQIIYDNACNLIMWVSSTTVPSTLRIPATHTHSVAHCVVIRYVFLIGIATCPSHPEKSVS